MEKKDIDSAKGTAKKAENIAFALQNCLDIKNGGEIAENLNYCYRHIRFATKNYLEKDKSNFYLMLILFQMSYLRLEGHEYFRCLKYSNSFLCYGILLLDTIIKA